MSSSRREFLRLTTGGALGVAALGVLVACGDSGETAAPAAEKAIAATTAAPTAAETEPADDAMMASAGVVIAAIQVGDVDIVRLTNMGAEAQDLSGWQLCQQPVYWALPSRSLGPGESLDIGLGDGDDTDEMVFAGGRIGAFETDEGNMALYNQASFADPNSLVHFVQWGSGGLGREREAYSAGLWSIGEFVAAGPLSGGGVLEYSGTGTGAEAWTSRAGTL